MDSIEQFEKNGFVIFKNFLEKDFVFMISNYFENKINRGEWVETEDSISRYSYYADPLIEVVLLMSKEPIENYIGKKLIPTYSYSRVYQTGEELKRHVDRPSCEISATINVASVGENSPIYMQYKENSEKEIFLQPGDCVIYKGCETFHWRKPLIETKLNVQFMLHYVDKNGLFSEYSIDKRKKYGLRQFL